MVSRNLHSNDRKCLLLLTVVTILTYSIQNMLYYCWHYRSLELEETRDILYTLHQLFTNGKVIPIFVRLLIDATLSLSLMHWIKNCLNVITGRVIQINFLLLYLSICINSQCRKVFWHFIKVHMNSLSHLVG